MKRNQSKQDQDKKRTMPYMPPSSSSGRNASHRNQLVRDPSFTQESTASRLQRASPGSRGHVVAGSSTSTDHSSSQRSNRNTPFCSAQQQSSSSLDVHSTSPRLATKGSSPGRSQLFAAGSSSSRDGSSKCSSFSRCQLSTNTSSSSGIEQSSERSASCLRITMFPCRHNKLVTDSSPVVTVHKRVECIPAKKSLSSRNELVVSLSSTTSNWRLSLEGEFLPRILTSLGDPAAEFVAIHDGPGGVHLAQYAGKHLKKFMLRLPDTSNKIEEGLKKVFVEIAQQLLFEDSGVLVLIKDNRLYCANADEKQAVARLHSMLENSLSDNSLCNVAGDSKGHGSGFVYLRHFDNSLSLAKALFEFVCGLHSKRRPDEHIFAAICTVRVSGEETAIEPNKGEMISSSSKSAENCSRAALHGVTSTTDLRTIRTERSIFTMVVHKSLSDKYLEHSLSDEEGAGDLVRLRESLLSIKTNQDCADVNTIFANSIPDVCVKTLVRLGQSTLEIMQTTKSIKTERLARDWTFKRSKRARYKRILKKAKPVRGRIRMPIIIIPSYVPKRTNRQTQTAATIGSAANRRGLLQNRPNGNQFRRARFVAAITLFLLMLWLLVALPIVMEITMSFLNMFGFQEASPPPPSYWQLFLSYLGDFRDIFPATK